MEKVLGFALRHGRSALLLLVALAHLTVIALVSFRLPAKTETAQDSADVFKVVDAREFQQPKIEQAPPPEKTVTVPVQAASAQTVVETQKTVVETPITEAYTPVEAPPAEEAIEYLPQHKISLVPKIPTERILSRIKYPELAAKQGIEGVVYLELYIDRTGVVRNIKVLKDPGFGFAAAALAAMDGVVCQPAEANGVPVAVRFRYPVRFTLRR